MKYDAKYDFFKLKIMFEKCPGFSVMGDVMFCVSVLDPRGPNDELIFIARMPSVDVLPI